MDETKQRLKVSRLLVAKAFLITKLQRALESMAAQGVTTAGNLLYGLLCVRLLSIDGYAKFSFLFAFQPSLFLLMDIGSTSALAPLIGERIDDFIEQLRSQANLHTPCKALVHVWNREIAPSVQSARVSTSISRISREFAWISG